MCGIFGYVGNKPARKILIDGLRTLEYRGYDSAGIFTPRGGVIQAVGPIAALEECLLVDDSSVAGIAHTRWATHGAPTLANAHPHHDATESIWIVHNGIIENYQELKEELAADGVTFYSDTDTEVLAKLIGRQRADTLQAAVVVALARVRGTYGLVAMHVDRPDELIVARMGSPIVLGVGSGEHFVSSDPAALLPHTKTVLYLEDGEVAVVSASACNISTLDGVHRQKATETIVGEAAQLQKQGFAHFMLKEIHEAPEVIENAIRGRLMAEEGTVKLGGIEPYLEVFSKLDRLTIVGCGSAYYAGLVGKYLLEEYAGLPVEVELASEYRYKRNYHLGNTAVLAVSQSGETADTLAAVRKAKAAGILTLGIVNVVGSSVARETDAGIYTHAGPEVAVASTKAFLSQITVFALLAILLGRQRQLSAENGKELIQALTELPQSIQKTLALSSYIAEIAKKYAHTRNMMFIGRTFHAPLAYEGALKLKEVSYLHAEGYAGGELKHGSIAMLDAEFPIVTLVPQDAVYEKMLANISEVQARSAPVIAIGTEGDTLLPKTVDDVILVPKVHEMLQPIISAIPLQLLAYHVGVAKGLNVDRPRNLAKSVTVE
ncbi:glutamine--fructose-6-phosphate transaminase (isomerizing) [Candidatus Kaiserbacteria bacterium]|nr:glutamine--fructose-6-phosphate transaminase (isomerizing) [Candidatus Kaiserbacteria bacterium]MCB9811297.1 glutamine--fructose-6-phosphate transaminase (isomerizing) [Candidatus Nomurabacteria bacterium]